MSDLILAKKWSKKGKELNLKRNIDQSHLWINIHGDLYLKNVKIFHFYKREFYICNIKYFPIFKLKYENFILN